MTFPLRITIDIDATAYVREYGETATYEEITDHVREMAEQALIDRFAPFDYATVREYATRNADMLNDPRLARPKAKGQRTLDMENVDGTHSLPPQGFAR